MSGDPAQQLERAYEEHADGLFRYGVFKLSDREQAEDLLQETFVRAWKYVSSNEAVGNFKAFLYKIMSNLIIDEYRKRKPIDSLDAMGDADGFDPPFDDTERWFDAIDGERAVALIARVPPPYSEAVFMRYVQELTLREISEITGERENTVAVHIHRGLDRLRTLYFEKHHDPHP